VEQIVNELHSVDLADAIHQNHETSESDLGYVPFVDPMSSATELNTSSLLIWDLLRSIVAGKHIHCVLSSEILIIEWQAFIIFSMVSFFSNKKRNTFQRQIGITMKFMGAPAAVVDLLNSLGVSVSHSTLHKLLDTAANHIHSNRRLLPNLYLPYQVAPIYGKVDMMEKIFEKGVSPNH
jgi:hypothetical protein